MIIGVTGFFASGKDTCAAYLERKGYQHVSLSDIIRDELRERNMEITIPNLTKVGNELRREHGAGVLAERAIQRFEPSRDYVVTSIRHPDEVRTLQRNDRKFALIFTDAPMKQRFDRSQARGRSGDNRSFEEFAAAEKRQMMGDDPDAQQLLACKELADVVLNNDSTLEAFYQRIDDALSHLP